MKKILTMVLVGLFAFVPMISVHAEEGVAVVKNEEELLAALADESVTTIQLADNITTTAKVNIIRDVTIDGQNYKITLSGDHTTWDSTYVIQVYKSNVTLKNIALTGANGGLLVNGGNATVEGTLDVSGNSFGGIELSKGSAVNTAPTINFNNATIKNDTESNSQPTLWTDGLKKEEVTIKYNGVEAAIYNTDKEQVQLFISETNTPTGENIEELDAADYRPEQKPEEKPEEPVTPPTEETDKTENPETSDGILLFITLAIVGFSGTAVTYKRLHN